MTGACLLSTPQRPGPLYNAIVIGQRNRRHVPLALCDALPLYPALQGVGREHPHPFPHRIGDRRGQSVAVVWEKSPALYHRYAVFYTDHYAVYMGVIPSAQHRAISKLARKTNHVERFNCTLRQRVSRLVRATLSFSKKLSNHIGAIKYFICDYNLTKCAALPG